MNALDLPDPQLSLNRLLEGLPPEAARAFEAKLNLIRNRRERAQAKAFSEADKASPRFLFNAWYAIMPAAEEARVEIIRAAFDTNLTDDEALIDYVRDEFVHFMGATAVSFGQSAPQRNVGFVLREVANLVGTARQAGAAAQALVRSMRWDRGGAKKAVSGAASGPATVVLLTVNDHETDAIFEVFLGPTPSPVQQTIGGITYNLLGEHGGMRIVHTIGEMGSGGVSGSQQRTGEAISHWAPSAVVAVGIAFGVKEKTQEIGDVLCATQVMDYDLGRIGADGSITLRGSKGDVAGALLNRFRHAAALWRSQGNKTKVQFGVVLSGQKLVDNLDYREGLKALAPEAVGGEMEGTGVYAAAQAAKVDWAIVKGICDWGHAKNGSQKDAWQKQAAENATRFLKAAIDIGPLYQGAYMPAGDERIEGVGVGGRTEKIGADAPSIALGTRHRSCVQDGHDGRWLRVEVRNSGSSTIHDLEVKMESFDPHGASFLPLRLQRMHDEPHPLSLHPGESAFVDVASYEPTTQTLCLRLDHRFTPPLQIPRDNYSIVVAAFGRDVMPCRRKLDLTFENPGLPTLQLSEEQRGK